MNKQTIVLLIDVLAIFMTMALTGTGFLIEHMVRLSQEALLEHGKNIELYFWGIDRINWGYIHYVMGLILLGLVVTHIILHWDATYDLFYKFIYGQGIKKIITIVFVVLCILALVVPYFAKPEVKEIRKEDIEFKQDNKKVQAL